MNELIKQLAGKALDKAVPYTWHSLDHVEVEKVMKEFAELIVSECCDIVGDYYGQIKKSGPGYTMICEIKQHFGVNQ